MKIIIISTLISCLCLSCRDNTNIKTAEVVFKEIKKESEILLHENEKSLIGKINQAILFNDTLFILDVKPPSIKIYTNKGEFIKSHLIQGRGPGEISNPVGIDIDGHNLVVADAGVMTYKKFRRFGESFFYEKAYADKKERLITGMGTLKITGNYIYSTFPFIYGIAKSPPIIVIDDENQIQEFGTYPNVYKKYSKPTFLMDDTRYLAIDKKNEKIYLTFSSSPSIEIIEIKDKKSIIILNDSLTERYISKERMTKDIFDIEDMKNISFLESYNYNIDLLKDTILVRAFCRKNAESSLYRSFVKRINFVEFFDLRGNSLGGCEIKGRFHHCAQDMLLIEESDEPDNRRFGLYKVEFSTPTP
ncbi:MAG: hypothetical protein SNJ77_11220 [Cytophagales bacterium]